jgi:ParB family chromosome partitioning protein
MRHELKLSGMWFNDVAEGRKTFELRKNDRPSGFRVGDELLLAESNWVSGVVTGRSVLVVVDYVLGGDDVPGLQPGYVALGIRVVPS